ncbi:MAG: FecR domain-containing protein [Akkermansiaceae bacterium]|jgi:hypothetical protein
MTFPSPEFDQVVAAICHGTVTDEGAGAMNVLLRSDPRARDEYLFRLELHARLASDPDLLAVPDEGDKGISQLSHEKTSGKRVLVGGLLAVAACFVIATLGMWWTPSSGQEEPQAGSPPEMTSKAVAMLNQVYEAEWSAGGDHPLVGGPLEPGWLYLKSGLAEIVFYSGARIVIQGPADVELISQNQASCPRGQLLAEVPPQARGFRVDTPRVDLTDHGTSFGLIVTENESEVHVFEGMVSLDRAKDGLPIYLKEGEGMVVEGTLSPREIPASQTVFTPLFYLESAAAIADTECFERSRMASRALNQDASLLVHLDFEGVGASEWRLPNAGYFRTGESEASIIGCEWTSGRWREKQALAFQGVSDRVRLAVPGEYESLTLAAWVRVQGLDRRINSLFMSDGFDAGTLHWSIRSDGVLGLTAIGRNPKDYQIVASPPVIKLDRFGRWVHLAVVLDGEKGRVVHYVDGQTVIGDALRIEGPFRIGAAELGNWNPRGFSGNNPFHIRNFSGAMDEFLLYSRALTSDEIERIHSEGSPEITFSTSGELSKK